MVTIKEKAEIISEKLTEIQMIINGMADVVSMILESRTLNETVYELSNEQQQSLIDFYNKEKTKLETKVKELI